MSNGRQRSFGVAHFQLSNKVEEQAKKEGSLGFYKVALGYPLKEFQPRIEEEEEEIGIVYMRYMKNKVEERSKEEATLGFYKVALGYPLKEFQPTIEEEEEVVYSEDEKYWQSFENKLSKEAIKAYNTWTNNFMKKLYNKYGEDWTMEEIKEEAADGDSIAMELLRKLSVWNEYYEDYNNEIINKKQEIEWARQEREEAAREKEEARQESRRQEQIQKQEKKTGDGGFIAGWIAYDLINKHRSNKEKEETIRRQREETWKKFETDRVARSKAEDNKRRQERLRIEHEAHERWNRDLERIRKRNRTT